MRILRSIRSVNPAGGGPIEGIKQVARVLQNSGHEVELVSLDDPDDSWVKACPLRVHAMGPVRSGYGYSNRFVPWLAQHRKNYDAVIVSGVWQYNSFGVWRALHGTDTPYFVFPHGMLDPWFKRTYPLKHLKKWLYWPWAEYRVLRDAKAVLFTSEEERRAARESFWLYRCNEVVVNYGVAGPGGDAEAQKKIALERFPQLDGKRIFLHLGRIQVKKGCDILIKGFAKAAATHAENLLVMAGPDQTDWVKDLKELSGHLGVSDKILWTGMVEGDIKWGMLRLAEVFVLPSHQENFGIAVAEALACGTPVLISNKVNIWREIAEDQAGFVDEDDETGVSSLLQRWGNIPPEQKTQMRLRSRQCFEARFEVHRAADSLITTMQTALAKR